MRAWVCVLPVVVPRRMMDVKERSSIGRSLIGCAVLVMHKRYDKRAYIPTNLNYAVLMWLDKMEKLLLFSFEISITRFSKTVYWSLNAKSLR